MFSIICKNTDISNYIISFERNVQICTGIGTLDFVVTKNVPISFSTWDTVLLYENGIKKGTFNISTIEREGSTGNYLISCQDNSKRLVDYFITDFYEINYYSTAKYWIEKFLTEAGVDYIFNTNSEGSPLSENTSLGLNSAYDTIIYLLQLSGWYLYFNGDGKAVIGNLEVSLTSPSHTFGDDEIVNITESINDSMLRNRAVVWGNSGIFYDNSVNTQWNYDANDKRAVVLANSGIRDYTTASQLGEKILDEFAKITDTVTIECPGYYNLEIGKVIRVNSKHYNGSGLITTLSTRGSSNGFVTVITINERCPRLFGFYTFYGKYVYIATMGTGVWRKALDTTGNFEDFSSGLTDLNVIDLYVANDILACVTSSGKLFIRNATDFNWSQASWGDLLDEIDNEYVPSASIVAKACTINRDTSVVYVLLTGSGRVWVGMLTGTAVSSTKQLYLEINGEIYRYINGYDLDTDNSQIIVTCGVGSILFPIFIQYPFPVIEAFTYNDTEEFRVFGNNYGMLPSDLAWDYGKVHYIVPPIDYSTRTGDPTSFYVYSHDFRTSSVITTKSPKITVSGENFSKSHVFLSSDRLSLYIVTNHYYYKNLYKHVLGSSDVTYIKTFSSGTVYGNTLINITTSDNEIDGEIYRTYTLVWEDLETQATGSVDFATIILRDYQWIESCGTWNHFGNVGLLYYSVAKYINHPDDNYIVGLHSYDEKYFLYVNMFGIIFNCISKEVIVKFNKLIHPQPDLEPSDSYCTTHADLFVHGYHQWLIARWTKLNYKDGIPWIWGQYTIVDWGPWVFNGLYYEYLGHREGYSESNAYPRVFKYNPISDELIALDDSKYNVVYNSGQYQEYLGGIFLSNSPDSDYWNKQYTAGVAILNPWRDVDQNIVPNEYFTFDNLYSFQAYEQHKMDFFYYEYPIVNTRTPLYNKYGLIGFSWWLSTYPPTPVASRPTTSGYTHRINIKSKTYPSPSTEPYPKILKQVASQNVFAVQYSEPYYKNKYGEYAINYGWEFYQFGDWTDFLSKAYYTALILTSGSSPIIDITSSPHVIEAGNNGIIATYAKNISPSGLFVPSGVPSGVLRVGTSYSLSGLSFPSGYIPGSGFPAGQYPDYTFITPAGEYTNILDARLFTLPSGITVLSGQYEASGYNHLGIAMDNSIYLYDINASGEWKILNTFSGYTTNFETSNFYDTPYFFVATLSGIATPSGPSSFYQRSTDEITWNFSQPPSGYITAIRLDDKL